MNGWEGGEVTVFRLDVSMDYVVFVEVGKRLCNVDEPSETVFGCELNMRVVGMKPLALEDLIQ